MRVRGYPQIGYYPPTQLRSPDRKAVAFGGEVGLKIVDLVHRSFFVPHLGESCSGWPMLWRRQDRLIIGLWCGSAHVSTRSELLVLDPGRRRFVARRQIGFGPSATAGALLVLVTSPPLGPHDVPGTAIREEREGPASLLRVHADGHVDETGLPLRAGSNDDRTFNRSIALVVDEKHRQAYVLGEGEGCARVDLHTLDVEWHRLPHAFDAQPGLASKPEPHRGTANPSRDLDRSAYWLGGGRVAVTGQDTWSPHGFDRTAPAGLKILDTRTWTVRGVNRLVSTLTLVRGRLIATGPRAGLTVYDLNGRLLLRRYPGKEVWFQGVVGKRIRVSISGTGLATVDLP
jgi:hypothetical protein